MKLFRTKMWSPVSIASLKWCCILLGMIAGAYLSRFTKSYVWFFAAAALLLAIKPFVTYFGHKGVVRRKDPAGSVWSEHVYNQPTREEAERYLTVIRDMIQHENALLNQRLSWLFAVQSLLFGVAGYLWRVDSMLPVIALGVVGILACASIGYTLARGQDAIKRLLIAKGQEYQKRLPLKWLMPPIIGSGRKAREWLLPGRLLPWALGAAWVAILVLRIARFAP